MRRITTWLAAGVATSLFCFASTMPMSLVVDTVISKEQTVNRSGVNRPAMLFAGGESQTRSVTRDNRGSSKSKP